MTNQGRSPRSSGWQPRPSRTGTRSSSGFRPRAARRGDPAVAAAFYGGDAVLSAESSSPSDLSALSTARFGGRAIALAGLVVVAGVLLSRVLGWLRVSVFYATYGGQSRDLDAFFAAFRIPDTLFQLVAAGAVGSALVPVVSELLAHNEPERARRVVATVGNLMILVLIPLAVLVWLAAPFVVPIIAPSPDPAKLELEIELTRWMLLSPILLALGAVMTAGLNSIGIFGAPALAPNVYNLAIIVCAIALTPTMGIYALALGVVLGAAGHVATQAIAVGRAGMYRFVLDVHDPAVHETLRLMAPRALGLGATQIVFLVNTYFALSLGDGPNSIYTGAFTALQIPVGLIGVPLGIVLLPPLSQAIARGDDERFRHLVEHSMRLLLFVVIPLTGLMLVLAAPSIALLYQHGNFTAADTATMTPVFLIFGLGLVAHVLIALLAPIFYAGKDTRTPVAAALVAVALDVVAAVALFPFFGLGGLALAIGLGAWAEVAMLLVLMQRRIGFDLHPVGQAAAAFVPGAALASAAALGTDRLISGLGGGSTWTPLLVLELGLAVAVAAAVYLAWSRLLRLPELTAATDLAAALVRRR
jgi:putative peptidoglycan lipid II flippase